MDHCSSTYDLASLFETLIEGALSPSTYDLASLFETLIEGDHCSSTYDLASLFETLIEGALSSSTYDLDTPSIHGYTCWAPSPPTHSLTHSLTRVPHYSLPHSTATRAGLPPPPLTHSLTHSPVCLTTPSLTPRLHVLCSLTHSSTRVPHYATRIIMTV